MVKKNEPEKDTETPRDFSNQERIKETVENPETDIFDEVLEGKKPETAKKDDFEENAPIEEDAEKDTEDDEENEEDEDDEEDEEAEEEPTEELEEGKKEKKDPKEDEKGEEEELEGDLQNDESEIDVEKETGTKEEGIKEDDPIREDIKETIMQKAALLSSKDPGTSDLLPLNFLEDKPSGKVFIGRKKNVFKQYGFEGALLLGKVNESEHKGKQVYLDGLNPHVVFVCGARGSGKSYALGIIAEELALKNKNVGTILIDPIGVFWSMRFPNKEEKELQKLKEWKLKTQGIENIKVFIPEGMTTSVPKSTFDKGFSILPSFLTGEDWSLTFSIDRFSVTGLLLEQAIKKVEKGYKETETNKKIAAKGKKYSLDDIIDCLQKDSVINSREKGYKQDSIRALTSRFEAAKNWGIFGEKGTPLGELSREGQLTILDTSFLEDNVTALVIGVLARRLLAARKISTRKEAAQKFKSFDVEQLLELEVPPTWLIVDEAHTLIPSGNEKTPASMPLIEYAKQGRRPGCSLVFATQQPSAIDTKVLSQLDIILTHKLVFDDDVKAVNKRTPTIIPARYRKSNFIKTLPVGVAMVGDRREETTRAFVMDIRPRFSQHEGRDVEATEIGKDLNPEQAKQLAIEMIHKDILKAGKLGIDEIENVIDLMNSKYNAKLDIDTVLDDLEEKGIFIGDQTVFVEEPKNLQEENEELADDSEELEDGSEEFSKKEAAKEVVEELENISGTELLALPNRIDKQKAEQIINRVRKKKILGFFGGEEKLDNLTLKYLTLWKVKYDVISRSGKEFLSRECFIDANSGEFVHFSENKFIESNGLKHFFELGPESIFVLQLLKKSPSTLEELVAKTEYDEGKIYRTLKKLNEKNLIGAMVDKNNKRTYGLKEKLDLPPNERNDLLNSINDLPFVRVPVINKEHEIFSKKKIPEVLKKIWKNTVVKDISEIYKPVWIADLISKEKERTVLVDGVTGSFISK